MCPGKETNMEKKYKITLHDGTVIDNLSLNGNNFVSNTEIDPHLFEDNLCGVVINDGENDDRHENMAFVGSSTVNGKFYFILRDMSEEELARIQFRSDLEYLAMMCEVDL